MDRRERILGTMKFNGFFAIVQLFMCFVLSARASPQTNKVIIGYANFSPTYASVWVAKEMGFFEKHNLNADIIFIRGGAMGTQALVSRSFDFIVAGGVAAVEAALSGAEIVIVAVPSNRMDQVLVARKEISQPVQLKGKKIAVNSLVGSAILAIKILLQALGLNPEKDVTYVTSGDPATRLAALQSGLVEATGLSPPFTLTAKRGIQCVRQHSCVRESGIPVSLPYRPARIGSKRSITYRQGYPIHNRSGSFFQNTQIGVEADFAKIS